MGEVIYKTDDYSPPYYEARMWERLGRCEAVTRSGHRCRNTRCCRTHGTTALTLSRGDGAAKGGDS